MTWTSAALGAVAAVPVYVGLRRVFDDVYERAMSHQVRKAKLDAYRQRQALEALQHIQPDDNARGGWIVKPDGSIMNLDTRTVLDSDWQVRFLDPIVERMDRIERVMIAGPSSVEHIDQLVPDPTPLLPEFVSTEQVMDAAPSYRRMVLGRTEHETITADMASLVHVAVGGSSGWGKSVFLRWLVYQLVKSTDPIQLALIDLEGATLAPFANSDRVLWPVADTETDAGAIMTELTSELDRRKELYSDYPGVDSLYSYNDEASEPLTPIVTVIDEATALLENKTVEGHLRTLALRARKYGLWLVLAGQDWKANTLDTAIRNQLGARVHFRAMSPSQSRVLLGQAGAEDLNVKGRAIAVLPGRAPFEFQSPMIKHSQIRGLGGNGPVCEMPVLSTDDVSTEKAMRVLELHNDGESDTAIARAVYGYGNSFYIGKVREILQQQRQ